jgi:nucleoside-diphosphate-sugar epimerase
VQTAFVLGGTGQVGRAAARALDAAGWDVTVAGRTEPAERAPGRFVSLDRTQAGALEAALGDGVDVLVDVIPLRAADGEQLRALAGRVGSVVAVSTAGVYVDARGRTLSDPEAEFPVPITERQPTVAPGGDDYHSTKRTIELALLEDDRLRATIVRPCAIHGPHGRLLREWYFVKRALDGRRAVVLAHRGSGRFHTTSVDNLAEVIRLSAQRPGTRVVNCGDPEPPTVLEIGRAVAALLDVEWTEVLLPGAELGSVGEHPWNTPHPFVVDMTAAEIELGYRPVVTYPRAVERTVAWLVDATRGRPWEEALPALVEHLSPMLDYAAEDRFLASLGS